MIYSQDSFLEDMCTRGYAKVKASELRTLLQNYEKLKLENKQLKIKCKAYIDRIEALELSNDILNNVPCVSLKS